MCSRSIPIRDDPAAETRPLAKRPAEYAIALRYEDLDAATVERLKSHVIDTLGCGIAAFDERPVRVCRKIPKSAQGDSTIIGTAAGVRIRFTVGLKAPD